MPSSIANLRNSAPVSLVTLCPEDDELTPLELVASEPPGPQQAVTVLVAPQGRDEEHERPGDTVLGHVGPCCTGVTWLEDVVVDCFVDEADLLWIDLEILVYLGTQAVGVDDDRVRQADRALIVQPTLGPRREGDGFRSRVCMHRLHVDHK